MEYQGIREYQIRQRAKNVAETPWLIMPGENKLTRRAIKLSFIKDRSDPDKFVGIHAEVLFQKRKNQKEPWPSKVVNLTKVPTNFGFKFSLDSTQTYELSQALQDAYPIGAEKIASGKRTVLRGVDRDEITITDKNKTKILSQLSSQLSEEDIHEWLSSNVSAISTDLALARLYHSRKNQIVEFKKALERDEDEKFWQKFLKENSWMFGAACIDILSERRVDIHHSTDFPIKIEGGFMDIVEIKTPASPFWTLTRDKSLYKYRDKFLIPNSQLQGALAQTTKYILQAEKQVDSQDYISDHDGIVPLKPRGLIVHGRSKGWGKNEWEAFRLLNDELHNIQVITFDHLLKQGERMLSVMQIPDENPVLEEVKEIRPEDIRF